MKEFIEDLFKPGFLERASREEKRIENLEHQEECRDNRTDMEQGYHDSGMRESDFY